MRIRILKSRHLYVVWHLYYNDRDTGNDTESVNVSKPKQVLIILLSSGRAFIYICPRVSENTLLFFSLVEDK